MQKLHYFQLRTIGDISIGHENGGIVTLQRDQCAA